MIGLSVLAAVPVGLYFFYAIQSANLAFKWPAVQLLGATTILFSVLTLTVPLHFLLSSTHVAAIATGIWLLAVVYAIWRASHIDTTTLEIHSEKIRHPRRLLHLSDIHAGSRSRRFISKIVAQSRALKPDLVFITGDVLDSSAVDANYLDPLAQFECPVLLCIGNHERYVKLDAAIDALASNKVQVLRNKAFTAQDLNIIGIDDADDPMQVEKQLANIYVDPQKFNILLYHRPHGFSAAAKAGIELMLSGHTHAGQIWPFGMLVKRVFPRIAGKYTKDASTLYVSQGTGTWGPTMRLGTLSEMTLIELQPKPSN